MNSLRQVQPHGSSSSSSRRPTPSRPSKPAKTLVVFACRPRFSTSYSHHCKGLPLCIGWPSPAYRMVFVTMASLTRQFGREYPEEGQGVQAVGSIVTPPPPRGVCLDTVRLSFGNTPASCLMGSIARSRATWPPAVEPAPVSPGGLCVWVRQDHRVSVCVAKRKKTSNH